LLRQNSVLIMDVWLCNKKSSVLSRGVKDELVEKVRQSTKSKIGLV